MLAGKKTLRVLLTAVLVLSMTILPSFTSPLSLTAGAETIADLQQKADSLAAQKKQKESEIAGLKSDISKQSQYKAAIDAQVTTIQQQIDVANQQISALDADIVKKESEIAGKEQGIKDTLEKFKQRLRAIYMLGDFNTLDIVLNAQNINDFIDRSELMQSFNDRDTAMLNQLRTDKESIAAQKTAIEQNRTQVAETKKGLDEKKAEQSALQQESQKVLSSLNANKAQADKEKKAIEAEENATADKIDQLTKQMASGDYVGGDFTWPVPGFTYISSNFYDTSGRSSMHRAIDIAGHSIYGARIVAANSGVVTYVATGWGGGYGNHLIIDHGGGWTTLYAHCSSLAVSQGQTVQKGQTIAYVGSTGSSTGPHCHFEMRKFGTRIDPMTVFH